MGRRCSTKKGNYILKSNLPIGVKTMILKSLDEQRSLSSANLCSKHDAYVLRQVSGKL